MYGDNNTLTIRVLTTTCNDGQVKSHATKNFTSLQSVKVDPTK